MLRSLSAMFCFIAVSAIPTARDAPARTATEVKALNDQIVDVVSKQLQARDEEAKKVAALAADEEAKLDAIAERIAGKVHQARAQTVINNNKDGCTMTSLPGVNQFSCDPPGCNAACTNNGGGGGGSGGGGSNPCFDKSSTTTCLLASPTAECEHVLMADLSPGDLVLGRDGATTVVAVQHKAVDTVAEMLTFHTAGGAVSMTPNHGIFVDGELITAEDVKVGAALSTGAVERITKGEALIINAVTMDGTIVADGVLATSNPMWIASLTVDAPITRAIVNAVLYAAGDVDSVAAGSAKVVGTLACAALIAKALRLRKSSSA